jgi:hypothetical protein
VMQEIASYEFIEFSRTQQVAFQKTFVFVGYIAGRERGK